METIWRPKSPHLLTEKQKQEKLKKDSEYEIAHLNLTVGFKLGRISKTEFVIQHQKQWNGYLEWAQSAGLYEEITPEQRLTEAENGLTMQIEQVNLIRAELKKPLLEVKEKTEKVK